MLRLQVCHEVRLTGIFQELEAVVPISIEHVVIAHEGAFRHPPFRRGPPRALRQLFHALVPDVAFDMLKASDQLEILAKKLHKTLNQSRATSR